MQKLLLLILFIFGCMSNDDDQPLSYVLRDEKFYRYVSSERQGYLSEYICNWNDYMQGCKQEIINQWTADRQFDEIFKVINSIAKQLKHVWHMFSVRHSANVFIFDDARVTNSIKKLWETIQELFVNSGVPTKICNQFLFFFHLLQMKEEFYGLFGLMKQKDNKFGKRDIDTYAAMIKTIPDFQTNYNDADKLFWKYFDDIEEKKLTFNDQFWQTVFKTFLAYDMDELKENILDFDLIEGQFEYVKQLVKENTKEMEAVQRKFDKLKPLSYVWRDKTFRRYVRKADQQNIVDIMRYWVRVLKNPERMLQKWDTNLKFKEISSTLSDILDKLMDIRIKFQKTHGPSVLILNKPQIRNLINMIFEIINQIFDDSPIPTQICNSFLYIYHFLRMKKEFYHLFNLMKNNNDKYGEPDIKTYSIMIKTIPDFQTNYDEADNLFWKYFGDIEAKQLQFDDQFWIHVINSFLGYDPKEVTQNQRIHAAITEEIRYIYQFTGYSKPMEAVNEKLWIF